MVVSTLHSSGFKWCSGSGCYLDEQFYRILRYFVKSRNLSFPVSFVGTQRFWDLANESSHVSGGQCMRGPSELGSGFWFNFGSTSKLVIRYLHLLSPESYQSPTESFISSSFFQKING